MNNFFKGLFCFLDEIYELQFFIMLYEYHWGMVLRAARFNISCSKFMYD